jgi:hypothetical protein
VKVVKVNFPIRIGAKSPPPQKENKTKKNKTKKQKKSKEKTIKKIERPLIQKIWTVGLVTIYFMLISLDRPIADAASKSFQILEQVSIATRYRIYSFFKYF